MKNYTTDTIVSQDDWNECLQAFPEANFLQSWEWGVFEEKLGKRVVREAVFEDGQCVACAQAVIEKAKRGDYMTVAGGPLVKDWFDEELLGLILSGVRRHALEEDVVFIRIRPQQERTKESLRALEKNSYRLAPMHLTADQTLQLDLSLDDQALFEQMRKNTRYSIRKAYKMGITVTQSQDPDDINEFYEIQCQLAKKQKFIPFTLDFLQKQFEVFAAVDKAVLFRSYHEGALLAAAFVIFYNQEAVYHYGVSTDANHTKPGSYACQWAAIEAAKQRGCAKYNFWGVSPDDNPNHRFSGVSLFKRGFGGQEVAYIPAHDLPLSKQYWLVWLFEHFRKKVRHL